MIVKTLGLRVTGTEVCPFSDVASGLSESDPLCPDHYVAVCAANKITNGHNAAQTLFSPTLSIRRSQLISMIVRAAEQFASDVLVAAAVAIVVTPVNDPPVAQSRTPRTSPRLYKAVY